MMSKGVGRGIATVACVLFSIAAFGCGGSDDSGGDTAAEERNQALVAEAESVDGAAAEIEETLRLHLAPYYYAGVEQTFALPDGSLCSIGEVYGTKEEFTGLESDPNILVSPDGEQAIRVEKFQGTERAPCLQAAGDAMDWLGEEEPAEDSVELTAAELVAEADAICEVSNVAFDRFFDGANSFGEQARAASLVRPGFIERVEELEALQPPAELSADYDLYTAALRDEIEIFDREQAANAAIDSASSIGEKVARSDRADLKQAFEDLDENYDTRHRLAKTIGFEVCGN